MIIFRAYLLVLILTTTAHAQGLPRQPGELTPTAALIAKAKQLFRDQCNSGLHCEYHFRIWGGGLIWACVYQGGNGRFCTRTPLSEVRKIDKVIEDYCEHSGGEQPYHALTGEAIVLNYECVNGRMKREPFASEFDMDGWMNREWRLLPR